jgi:hypothetical protein
MYNFWSHWFQWKDNVSLALYIFLYIGRTKSASMLIQTNSFLRQKMYPHKIQWKRKKNIIFYARDMPLYKIIYISLILHFCYCYSTENWIFFALFYYFYFIFPPASLTIGSPICDESKKKVSYFYKSRIFFLISGWRINQVLHILHLAFVEV